MRKWTLAQGGGIGAKDVSTLQWQKIEYGNCGPDGMCSPLAGGSHHSWNQLISWKEAERPSLFDGLVQFTPDRHPKVGFVAHRLDWPISSMPRFWSGTSPQDLSPLPSLILPYFSKFHFPDVLGFYLCVQCKGLASLFPLTTGPPPCWDGNDYVPPLPLVPFQGLGFGEAILSIIKQTPWNMEWNTTFTWNFKTKHKISRKASALSFDLGSFPLR